MATELLFTEGSPAIDVELMPRHIQALIRTKGGLTKYEAARSFHYTAILFRYTILANYLSISLCNFNLVHLFCHRTIVGLGLVYVVCDGVGRTRKQQGLSYEVCCVGKSPYLQKNTISVRPCSTNESQELNTKKLVVNVYMRSV